jgi:RecA-family ATPase
LASALIKVRLHLPLPVEYQPLIEKPQWVLVRAEPKQGEHHRFDKVPYQVRYPAEKAKSNKPGTWASYAEAVAAYQQGHGDMLGFIVTPDCGLGFIDLDDCCDANKLHVESFAFYVMTEALSLTEFTPSGRGLRVYVRVAPHSGESISQKVRIPQYGPEPPLYPGGSSLELYRNTNRLVVVTGAVAFYAREIARGDELLDDLCERFKPGKGKAKVEAVEVADSDGEAYARQQLQKAAEMLEGMRHGDGRNNFLNSALYTLGGFAPHWIDPQEIVERMREAALASYGARLPRKVEIMLERVVNDGMQKPITKLPGRRAERGVEEGTLDIVDTDEIDSQPLNWLWFGHFAIGKIGLMGGHPGVGKSLVTIDIASRIRRGEPWPDGSGSAPKGNVIILTTEDDPADTIKPRMEAAGGGNVRIVRSIKLKAGRRRGFDIMSDLPLLEREIERVGDVVLVVIDPLSAYMGKPGKSNTWKDSDVRATLEPLAEMAGRIKVAVIGIMHFGKEARQSALMSFLGSVGFGALARTAFAVILELNEDEQETGRVLFLEAKRPNIAAKQPGLAFRIEERATRKENIRAPAIVWDAEPVRMSADQAMRTNAATQRKERKDKECENFLATILAMGRMAVTEIEKLAKQKGYSENRLKAAKVKVCAEAVYDNEQRKWFWCIPGRPGADEQTGPPF